MKYLLSEEEYKELKTNGNNVFTLHVYPYLVGSTFTKTISWEGNVPDELLTIIEKNNKAIYDANKEIEEKHKKMQDDLEDWAFLKWYSELNWFQKLFTRRKD